MAVEKKHHNVSKYQRMTPEQKARHLKTCVAWQKANPDKVAEYKRKRKKTSPSKNIKRNYVINRKIERGSCMDCGLSCDHTNHVCFAWDHLDPAQKRFRLGHASKYNWTSINEELAKCELVCHNCHALRSWRQKHYKIRRNVSVTVNNQQLTLFDSLP